jgi:hypothetical protein
MTHFELTRSSSDGRLYRLGGCGTLYLEGLFRSRATATAGAATWHIYNTGLLVRAIEATDASGTVIGRFEPKVVRRGGTLAWAGRHLMLEPSSLWRERYALAEHGVDLALFDGNSWGKTPVRLSVIGEGAADVGLLLLRPLGSVVGGVSQQYDRVDERRSQRGVVRRMTNLLACAIHHRLHHALHPALHRSGVGKTRK